MGLDELEDDVQTGADLRKHRKDASKQKRKKDAKRLKLAEKKRSKENVEMDINRHEAAGYEDEVVTSSAIWSVLCRRAPYLIPEHMDNLLIIEDSEEDGDIDREGLRNEMSQVVGKAMTESDGYLNVLRTFATSGKEELFNGEGKTSNSDSYFMFMLAAYLVLIDSHYGTSSTTSVDAIDIFNDYFRNGAWVTMEAEEAQERFQLLEHTLRAWDFTIETSESPAASGGMGRLSLSSRCVVVASQQGPSSSVDKGRAAISMHDAAAVGLMCTALEAVVSVGGDPCPCREAIRAELGRQAELFGRMDASLRRRGPSGSTITAFVKAAVVLVASARGVEGVEGLEGGLDTGIGEGEGEEEWGAQLQQAQAVCEAVGIFAAPPPMVVPPANSHGMAEEGSLADILRDCEGLKRSVDFQLPLTPFYDSFARSTIMHPALSQEDVTQIAIALIHALALKDTGASLDRLGACRFLAGMNAGKPLEQLLGAGRGKRVDKRTKQLWGELAGGGADGGMLARALDMSQQDFTQQVLLRIEDCR